MNTKILRDLRSLNVRQAMNKYHNENLFRRRAIDIAKLLEIDVEADLVELDDCYELWLDLCSPRVRFKGEQRIMEVLTRASRR